MRSALRSHRFALLFLVVAATSMFVLPLLRDEVFTLRDHFDYFQPLRWFTASELQAGRLPLWNPYNASGEPWLANPQTGVFYPPALLFLVLPFATAYMAYLLAHLVLLGWGAYLLFARTVSRGAALVGAIALLFSGPVLSLLDVSNNLATLAWIPLVLWCAAERAWRRGAIVLALSFLAGEPFFAAVGALLYVIVGSRRLFESSSLPVDRSSIRVDESVVGSRRVDESSSRQGAASASGVVVESSSLPVAESTSGHDTSGSPRRPEDSTTGSDHSTTRRLDDSTTRPLLLAGLFAFGLCAIQLLPFLELVRGSDRAAGLGAASVLYHSMRLDDWLRIAIPPEVAARMPAPGQQFIPIVYVGLSVLLLAVAGLRRRTLGWVVLLLAAAWISTGPEWLTRLPLTLFRYPSRLVPLGALAIAALAASGWDRIRRGDRRWLDLLMVLVVIADLAPRVWPLLESAPFRTDVVPYGREVGADSKILRVGPPDLLHREAWISGYLNLYARRFDAFTAAPVASEAYVRMHRRLLETPTREELAQKAIGWVVSSYDLAPAFTPVTRQGKVTVYRNQATLPMAALLVRNPLRLIPARVVLDSERARVEVDAPREGVVLLHQQDGPGWDVRIDGLAASSSVRGKLFRAVQVTQGRHVITWEYHPRSLVAGACITLFSLMALTVSSFVKRAR